MSTTFYKQLLKVSFADWLGIACLQAPCRFQSLRARFFRWAASTKRAARISRSSAQWFWPQVGRIVVVFLLLCFGWFGGCGWVFLKFSLLLRWWVWSLSLALDCLTLMGFLFSVVGIAVVSIASVVSGTTTSTFIFDVSSFSFFLVIYFFDLLID